MCVVIGMKANISSNEIYRVNSDKSTETFPFRDKLLPALAIEVMDGPTATIAEVLIEHLQIDDQSDEALWPIVLCPSPQKQVSRFNSYFLTN